MGQYKVYFQKINGLTLHKKQQMAAIYFKHYQGSDETRFYNDLHSKDEVLFLKYEQHIVGFSTLQYYFFQDNLIVYSGDTIVDPTHWKQTALHKAWIQRIGCLKKQFPQSPIYWFLLVKGYKTFKYLKLFAKHFYPHWEIQDTSLKTLAYQLADDKFGSLHQAGIIACTPDYGYLKPELAELSNAELKQEPAQFFLKANPLYYKGHELVCLCEISHNNLTSKAAKWFDEGDVLYCNE